MTSEIFVVEFGSGIFFFALFLYLLLLVASFVFIFHKRFSAFPVWQKWIVAAYVLCSSVACVVLGTRFRPFLNVKVSEKMGAFIDDVFQRTEIDFPPARPSAMIDTPPALDQGRAGTCWAYAGALALSTIKNQALPVQVSKLGCTEKTDVAKWSVSPQALIDLLDSPAKTSGAPTSKGLQLATRFALPTLFCVGGYTSQFTGQISSCPCGSPKTEWCLLPQTTMLQNEHLTCSDGTPTDKSNFFAGKTVVRLTGATAMEKAISNNVPVVVWLSFKRQGYPLWTGVGNDGISVKFRSEGYICRPRDEPNYSIEDVPGHAVCVVGYGVRDDQVKYWVIQNSWGTQWGKGGRAKIEAHVNAWGIEQYPFVII